MKRVPTAKSTKLEGVDDDAKSEGSTSQILTHEERQAVYEKTRARIFSDYVESQKGSSDVGEKASGTCAVGGGGSSDEAGSESPSPPPPQPPPLRIRIYKFFKQKTFTTLFGM